MQLLTIMVDKDFSIKANKISNKWAINHSHLFLKINKAKSNNSRLTKVLNNSIRTNLLSKAKNKLKVKIR